MRADVRAGTAEGAGEEPAAALTCRGAVWQEQSKQGALEMEEHMPSTGRDCAKALLIFAAVESWDVARPLARYSKRHWRGTQTS